MIDTKDTSTHPDDDFQLDDFDTAEALSPSEDTPSTSQQAFSSTSAGKASDPFNSAHFGPNKTRKLIILGVVVVIIILFIAYHFAKNWNNPLNEIAHTTKVVTQPTVPTAPSGPSAGEVITELSTKIGGLDQTIDQQQQTISQLQSNMNTLQDSVNTLGTSINTITQQLSIINDKLTKPAPKPKAVPLPAAPPVVHYIVKAMVPGRAWLQAGDGTSLSVSVGSDVPTHGTVTQLDLNAGQVTTSDGSVFNYDINVN